MREIRNQYITREISVQVNIYVAYDFLSKDSALLQLREGVGDKNNSKYTKEEFIREIEDGNLVVAMLREDPIGYAIVKEDAVVEIYVEWGFGDSKLESILLEESKKLFGI